MTIVYSIFFEDGSILVTKGGETLSLPTELARRPVCCYSGTSLVVYLNSGILTNESIVQLHDYINTIMKSFLEDGLVRVDFTDWHTMTLYSVDTSELPESEIGERYKNAEDLIDNFIRYRGPCIFA